MVPRLIGRASAIFALLAGTALSQNHYYVNGLTGADAPTAGSSAAQPWKTLTYAFTRIPRPSSSNTHTLHVAGGQFYSTRTNGETFPIRPKYNVTVVGSLAPTRPVIRVPAGSTGFQLDPATTYNRTQATYQGLVFAQGLVGIAMGGGPGARHRPTITDCEFLEQGTAGVTIVTQNSNTDDPRLFGTRFYRCNIGLHATAGGPDAVLRPDVEECAFEECTNEGMLIEDRSQSGSDVGGTVEHSFFNLNRRGLRLYVHTGAAGSRLEVDHSCFRCNGEEGIDVFVNRAADPAVTITSSVFIQGTYGVRAQGVFSPGSYTFTLRDNVAIECRIAGYSYQLSGSGNVRLVSENNLARACHDGFEIGNLSPGIALAYTSDGDRAWANRGIGLSLAGTATGSTASIVNGMFVDNALDGILLAPLGMATQARFLTIADNHGVGLRALLVQTPMTIDHCIIANNADGELAVPGGTSIRFSCVQNASYAGQGNIRADPLLIRPFYKLTSLSPCVDAGDRNSTSPARDYESDARRVATRSSTAIADMGADEFVARGCVQTYGLPGAGHPGFRPAIASPNDDVRIGETLEIRVVDAVDSARSAALGAILCLGSTEGPGLLGYDLTPSGAICSLLWQNLRFVVGVARIESDGSGSIRIPLPRAAALVDQVITFQWIVVKPGVNPAAFVTTDGLRAIIGQ